MKEFLIRYGYNEQEVNEFIEQGKLQEMNGEYLIVDSVLFTDFIEKVLDKGVNPILFFIKQDDPNSIMYHVFKYITLGMYKEAQMLLIYFNQEVESFYGRILFCGLEEKYAKDDQIEYIIDESKYDSDVVVENMKLQELSLLSAIELENDKSAYKLLMSIKNIYDKNQESLPFSVIAEFLMEIRRLSTNHRRVSHHTDFTMTGDFDSVVYGLLKEIDYYRLEQFLKDETYKNTKSIKIEIYNLLLDRIIYLNKLNVKYIQDSMLIDVQSKSLTEVMENPHMPYMTGEFINSLLNPVKEEDDDNTNYYQVYEALYKAKDFEGAKEALLKFDTNLKRMNVYKNIDYELNELDIWIENTKDLDEEEKTNLFETYDDCMELIENKKYEEAVNLLHYFSSLCKKTNPKVSSLIGMCYFEQKNYVLAIEYYTRAKDGYISPEDIYNLIYSYFKLGDYEKVLYYIPKYEHYYPDENVKLYYIKSICHVKLKEFSEAIDSLESCEAMNVIYYNMPIEYTREKEIIDKIQNGKNIECYTEDDFVDYELTAEETKLRDEISNGDVNVPTLIRKGTLKKTNIKDKIEYLFSCAKVYMQMDKEEEGNEICKFINSLISDPRLENKEKETFTLRLKNYTTI